MTYNKKTTIMKTIKFKKDDGGRSKYFKGENVRDCVTRAIAIATGKDYKEVYDDLHTRSKEYSGTSWSRTAKKMKKSGTTPRNGVFKEIYKPYIEEHGFKWVSTMKVGQGMKVHVNADELPSKGTLILKLSRHLACVKDGVLHDTYDCSREGTRGVYGYWIKE